MDQSTRFEFPRMGVSDAPPYTEAIGAVCPPDAMLNIWPREAGGGRWNLNTRSKLSVLLTAAGEATGHPVTAMGVVGTASGVTGYSGSNVKKIISGTNRNAGAWSGQAVVLNADWTVKAVLKDARGTGGAMSAPPASVGGHGSFSCCWHSTNDDVGYFCCIGEDIGHTTTASTIVLVDRFDLTASGGETLTHQAHLIDKDAPYTPPATGPYDPITCSQAVQIGPYLFVAARHYLYAFRADTLVYIERMAIDFAIEGQSIAGVTIGGVEYLLVGSTGSAVTTGAVVADSGADPKESFGEFGRACVSLYKLAYADAVAKTAVAVGDAPLVRVAMPQGTESGDDYYEDHRTFRVSEWGRARPRGCLLYSIAPASNGDVFIARTGQGFGCDGTQSDSKPDGAGEATHVARASLQAAYAVAPGAFVDPATSPTNYGFGLAAGGWERAIAGALVRPYVHGATVYQTDIPKIVAGARQADDTTQAPNAFAIAYASGLDVVCVGGNRINPADHQLAAFRGLDGAPGWTQSVGAMVPQNALAWDPLSGHFVVGTFRNKEWPGAAGEWAELFMVSVFTGEILRHWSLTNEVMNNGAFDFDSVVPITLGAGVYAVAVNRRGQVLAALAPFRLSA